MRKSFAIPLNYRSSIISTIKNYRNKKDRFRKDLSPTVLDLGRAVLKIARHFGFCYGVENAIEIAYRAIQENAGRTIYLVSEMIHNPHVNQDLQERGVKFLMKTDGNVLIPFENIKNNDVVIIPAFGISLDVLNSIRKYAPEVSIYDTTCPFVEKVWHRAESLGKKGFTIIIHGRFHHEETRATFSRAKQHAPAMVIQDKNEALILASTITGHVRKEEFFTRFGERLSSGFDPEKHLQRIGVVNQTTMLATETLEITAILKQAIRDKYGEENLEARFADTKDTLCYATWENQTALQEILKESSDLAIIVGGYNSSNTSHLVELCEEKMPTFYIKDEMEILSRKEIRHLDLRNRQIKTTVDWLPEKQPVSIVLSAGASCPDSLVDKVIRKIVEILGVEKELEIALQKFMVEQE